MNKRTLGLIMQLIGVVLFLFSSKALGAIGPLLGIALLIAGAIVYRKAKKTAITSGEKPKKSAAEKAVSITIITICAIIIGLLLMIIVPNFVKGYREAKQQSQQK